jgi:hypothetical protein
MKINITTIAVITLSSALSACGGGISIADNGGITGTGITTAGRVTGFGSIWVNGIRFNVDNATFTRDGVTSTGQSEFRIGEYVVIKGSVDKTTQSGIANDVSFTDLLDGAVTAVSTNNSTIEILGQSVEVDANTTLLDERDGSANTFPNLTDLALGNIVEVSGIKDSSGLIKATSIKLKKEVGTENELKGKINNINLSSKTFIIGNIFIDYSSANLEGFNGPPANNQFVEVKSSTTYNGSTLFAIKVKLEDENLETEVGAEFEIEGIVTRYVSDTDFDVNGISVTTTAETQYKKNLPSDVLELDVEIEVKGKTNSLGILVAEEIEFED